MSNFFNKQLEQSKVKTEIVLKYFDAWTKIMKKRAERMAYIDLFSGPGRFEDGRSSTPLLIIQKCIEDEILAKKMVTIFNDQDQKSAITLKQELEQLDGYNTLNFKPKISSDVVDIDMYKTFEKISLIPSLIFIDPFGYKGITYKLIRSITKDWGCDCIFFFNYNRIYAALFNEKVKHHINAIFGEDESKRLACELSQITDINEQEKLVLLSLTNKLNSLGLKYVLPYRFYNKSATRTSHFIIFVSKNPVAYKIMKDIMWGLSSSKIDDIASFSFFPHGSQMFLDFSQESSLDKLSEEILHMFKGKRVKTKDIFFKYQEDRPLNPYILKNFKDVLIRLEIENKIKGNPPIEKRYRNGKPTCGEKVEFYF